MTDERRKGDRRKALKGGRILFNGGWASFTCTIRNISESGAKLHVENVLGIPSEFTLAFDDRSPSRECIVRWRTPTLLGVEFK